MATTTNFGWETPDDTDLVKDGAAAIRTLGSSVDTSLEALSPETTLGDIAYRSATADTNTRLAIGSTGEVLTVAGGVPSWAAAAGGGKVLQVVQGTYATETSSSSVTFAATGLSASITPSLSTSKVLILFSIHYGKNDGNAINAVKIKLRRNTTDILTPAQLLGYTNSTLWNIGQVACNYLDSPATTSSIDYNVQFANNTNNASVQVQQQNQTSVFTLMEIGA